MISSEEIDDTSLEVKDIETFQTETKVKEEEENPIKKILNIKFQYLENIDKSFQLLMCTQYFGLGMRAMTSLAIQALFAKILKIDPSEA